MARSLPVRSLQISPMNGGFEHRLGSPGHQQTNSKAEATVKDAKCLLEKAKESKGDLYFEVLAQQNTPTEAMGTSPAQASVRFKRGFVRFVYLLFDNIFCGLVFMNHISLASQYIM